ncbi:MAG TPA: hypothetical protein VF686_06330 [Brevundimonas sp.]|jgi:hypothetical protein
MGAVEGVHLSRTERSRRRRVRAEKIEAVLIVGLAALVLFKGAPTIVGIALAIGEMAMDLIRLSGLV